MGSQLPKSPEEFQLWMVEKVGEMHTSLASISGKLDTSDARHEALRDRVDDIVKDQRTAKHWENGKILATFIVQTGLHLTRFIK